MISNSLDISCNHINFAQGMASLRFGRQRERGERERERGKRRERVKEAGSKEDVDYKIC